MKKYILLTFLAMACLFVAPTESNAQCPPEVDCDCCPPEGGGEDPYGVFYINCSTVVNNQGYNADGSTWMQVCERCTRCVTFYGADGEPENINCDYYSQVLRNCQYYGRDFFSSAGQEATNTDNATEVVLKN
jgi:hypothetical protein